jgi:NADH dehydrogenase FAD-containing subunit
MNNVAEILHRDGVVLNLGTAVNAVHSGHVLLSDGSTIKTHCVIWRAGLKAAAVASGAGLPQARGGRINVQHDLSVEGFPGVYAPGDFANIAGTDGDALPQLGSVAQQSGRWSAKNILAEIEGASPTLRSAITTKASWRRSVRTPPSLRSVSIATSWRGWWPTVCGSECILLGSPARS